MIQEEQSLHDPTKFHKDVDHYEFLKNYKNGESIIHFV